MRHIVREYGKCLGTLFYANLEIGNQDFRIMLLRRLQLDARQRVLRPGNSVSDRLHIAVVGQNYATPARGHVSAVMVLRLLTEDFGGEASCASLTERIVGQLSAFGKEDHLTEIRSVLAQLESCGSYAGIWVMV